MSADPFASGVRSPLAFLRAFGRGGMRRAQWPLVLVLVASLFLAGGLAWQAQQAVASQREVAEDALKDYASFALWELEQHVERDLLTALIMTHVGAAARVDPSDPSSWPTAESFQRIVEGRRVSLAYLDSVKAFVRFDWKDSALSVAAVSGPDLDAETTRWLRDTIAAHPRLFRATSPELRPLSFGSARPNTPNPQRLRVILTNDSYAMAFRRVAGRPQLLAFVVGRDLDGRALVTYGVLVDAQHFLTPVLAAARTGNPLLPPSLVKQVPEDSVLHVSISTPDGEVVFGDAHEVSTHFEARDTLGLRFGNLIMQVALEQNAAASLVVGGLPRSRLPWLAGIFVLTVALIVIAVVQLNRQQELAELRSGFVAGVSHELRTPLTQIRMFTELMRNGAMKSQQEQERSLIIIDEEAQRLGFLVENVLRFARGENPRGLPALQTEPVDVGEEVHDALEVFAPLARAREAQVDARLDEGLVAQLDPQAFRQVMLNLLDNAAKYGPPGQTITVCTSARDGQVLVTVEDEGPGIPKEHRLRVWEPYVRLPGKSGAGGTGIGLPIVRDLVRRQGGKAWVEEGEGRGARFVVAFPMTERRGAATAAPGGEAVGVGAVPE